MEEIHQILVRSIILHPDMFIARRVQFREIFVFMRILGDTFILPLAVVLTHYTCRFNTTLESSLPLDCDEKTQRRLQYELRDSIVINPSMVRLTTRHIPILMMSQTLYKVHR